MFPDEMTVDLDSWNTVYGLPAQQMRTLYCAAVVSNFLLFSSPNLSGRRLDVYHTSTDGVALVRI